MALECKGTHTKLHPLDFSLAGCHQVKVRGTGILKSTDRQIFPQEPVCFSGVECLQSMPQGLNGLVNRLLRCFLPVPSAFADRLPQHLTMDQRPIEQKLHLICREGFTIGVEFQPGLTDHIGVVGNVCQ